MTRGPDRSDSARQSVCYLCGRAITEGIVSADHAVPRVLIRRKQPRARGFDYAGTLPTHPECNNRFGPETYVLRAVELLAVLFGDDDAHFVVQHRTDPTIQVKAINAARLPHFKARDLAYFRMVDVRETDASVWSTPEFFQGKTRTNPEKSALEVAMSVLAKSAAALLISRELRAVPVFWNIYAWAFLGDIGPDGYSDVMGPATPFDDGVRCWLRQEGHHPAWFAVYQADKVLVHFLFVLSADVRPAETTLRIHCGDQQIHVFRGSCLNELLSAGWQRLEDRVGTPA